MSFSIGFDHFAMSGVEAKLILDTLNKR